MQVSMGLLTFRIAVMQLQIDFNFACPLTFLMALGRYKQGEGGDGEEAWHLVLPIRWETMLQKVNGPPISNGSYQSGRCQTWAA